MDHAPFEANLNLHCSPKQQSHPYSKLLISYPGNPSLPQHQHSHSNMAGVRSDRFYLMVFFSKLLSSWAHSHFAARAKMCPSRAPCHRSPATPGFQVFVTCTQGTAQAVAGFSPIYKRQKAKFLPGILGMLQLERQPQPPYFPPVRNNFCFGGFFGGITISRESNCEVG